MTHRERLLKVAKDDYQSELKAAQAIQAKADAENREPNTDEQSEIDSHMESLEAKQAEISDLEEKVARDKRWNEIAVSLKSEEDAPKDSNGGQPEAKSLGAEFVESKNFQNRHGSEVEAVEVKATLTSSGAGALVVPQYQQGVVNKLFQRPTIANLLPQGTTGGTVVHYTEESIADGSAVTTVAETGELPEIELAYEQKTTEVKDIGGMIAVSNNMLSDAPALQSQIDSRLTFFIQKAEEAELLNGSGSGTHVKGLLKYLAEDQTAVTAEGGKYASDHIYEAITLIRLNFLEPSGIVMHPRDWANLRLAKDTTENYIGNGPFSFEVQPGPSLWNIPVVITTAMTEGSVLVGDFAEGAQIFRNGGLVVESTQSHSDFFKKRLTAIRGYERLALAVYRPDAFATANVTIGS